MFPVMLAILAFAGAPATTPVTCSSTLPSAELGLTVASTITVHPDGTITPGPLDNIELGPLSCLALLYTSAPRSWRATIRKHNPHTNFNHLVGVGLQVALHEAEHVALNSPDECLVEKTTRGRINGLLETYADPGHLRATERQATLSDASLPAQYHGC